MTNDNKITFHSFTKLVASRAKVSRVDADAYIRQLAKTIGEELEKDGNISLYRFGHFHTTHVGEQVGHDPNTGEPLTIPEHTRVHFRPFKALRFFANVPFRQLRIKELTEDNSAWRTRTVTLIFLAVIVLLLILLGISFKSWISTPVVVPEITSSEVELERPVREVPVAAVPAEPKITPAPAPVAATPVEPETTPTPKTTATVIIVLPGDTLWAIATTIWGGPSWWPIIYSENRPVLSRRNPDFIDKEITLRIPVLAGSVYSPKTVDLRLKTNAYRIVGDDYRKLGSPRAAEYETAAARGFKE